MYKSLVALTGEGTSGFVRDWGVGDGHDEERGVGVGNAGVRRAEDGEPAATLGGGGGRGEVD